MTTGARGSRGYAVALVVGLLAATAVVVGAAKPWASATATAEGMPQLTASVDGADVAPLAGALGFVLLASFGAVIATRGWVRRGLGAAIAVVAVVVAVAAMFPSESTSAIEDNLAAKGWAGGDYSTHVVLWRWLVVTGAGFCALAGAAVLRFGGSWATMGSRYDAPRATAESAAVEADVWKAIDSGRDPTQQP